MKKKLNLLDDLPHEMLSQIYSQLDTQDQLNFISTCSRLYTLFSPNLYTTINLTDGLDIYNFNYKRYGNHIRLIRFKDPISTFNKLQFLQLLHYYHPNNQCKLICSCEIISESDKLLDHTKFSDGTCSCFNNPCKSKSSTEVTLAKNIQLLQSLTNFEIFEYTYKYKQLSYTGEAYNAFLKLETSSLLDKVKRLNIMIDGYKYVENDFQIFHRLDLSHLSFYFFNTIIEPDFITQLDTFKNLKELRVYSQLSLVDLNSLIQYKFSKLKHLSIYYSYCSNTAFTNRRQSKTSTIYFNGLNFPSLSHLDLQLNNIKFQFKNQFSNLESIATRFTSLIPILTFNLLLFPQLTTLLLSNHSNYSLKDKPCLISFKPNINTLNCKLSHLQLVSFMLDNSFLNLISKCKNVKILDITNCNY
ncbi:hypothetical protein K502DRAFT_363312 [Neoconidiobolus thromboides FSU 785]|nr:hypothetical protein K502DRAFT_363312 [Neoconidiobolus thromboides FSU 785]